MDGKILTDIKKLLGIPDDYEHFDVDILLHINSFLRVLNQVGVGVNSFTASKDSTWDEFLDGDTRLEEAKTFVYIRTRLVFDPPTSSFVADSLSKTADELLWRLNVEVDPGSEKLAEA